MIAIFYRLVNVFCSTLLSVRGLPRSQRDNRQIDSRTLHPTKVGPRYYGFCKLRLKLCVILRLPQKHPFDLVHSGEILVVCRDIDRRPEATSPHNVKLKDRHITMKDNDSSKSFPKPTAATTQLPLLSNNTSQSTATTQLSLEDGKSFSVSAGYVSDGGISD